MSSVAGVAAAVVVMIVAWGRRPVPVRLRSLCAVGRERGGLPRSVRQGTSGTSRSPAARLGGWLRRWAGRADDAEAARHLGRACLLALPAAALSPTLVAAVAVWWWGAPIVTRRRSARRRDAELRAELPEVVDLFLLAVGAGLTVALAVPAVARHHRGLIGLALDEVDRRVGLGERLADALGALPATLGEPVRPLATVLVGSERYGVALVPALERLASEARLERRRAAEATARRVPMKLLFPLVLCTLPAFALLTVVPLLAGSLRSLRL